MEPIAVSGDTTTTIYVLSGIITALVGVIMALAKKIKPVQTVTSKCIVTPEDREKLKGMSEKIDKLCYQGDTWTKFLEKISDILVENRATNQALTEALRQNTRVLQNITTDRVA